MFWEYKALPEYVKSISYEEMLKYNVKIEYRNQCALNERLFVSYSGCFLYIQIFLKGVINSKFTFTIALYSNLLKTFPLHPITKIYKKPKIKKHILKFKIERN